MKKFFSFALVLALAFSFVAPAATNAESTTYTRNLTIGERGGAVTQLQLFLQARGFFPATQAATGYFGPITRTAVAAYQTSKGITPAVGYFGPITIASVMAEEGMTTPVTTGCPAGAMYNTVTGAPCTGTPVTPGCPTGALFNSMTGAPCTANPAPTTPGLTGVEGIVDVLLSSSVTNNTNVQTSVDVPVLAVEFRGKIAPVAIQTLDLEVDVALSSSPSTKENPGTLINTIKIWDGSTVLATIPVNMSTFIRDSANKYYVRISGINLVVPQDTTKTLTASFSTNYIDTARLVAVSGYAGSGIRAVSGNGVSTFYPFTSGRNHTFNKPGNSTLTLSAVASPLRSQNVKLSTSNNKTMADAVLFNVKSENGDSKITTVTASTTVVGFTTSEVTYDLYDGSTRLDSVTAVGNTVTFANLSATVSKDQTKTLKVVVGFPSVALNTATGSAQVIVKRVAFDNVNGSNTPVVQDVTGSTQYAYGLSASYTHTPGTGAITVSNATFSSGSSTLSATFPVTVKAEGASWERSAASAVIRFVNSANTAASTTVAASIVTPGNNDIADGASTGISISGTVVATGNANLTNGQYVAQVESITWKVGANTVTQTYGLEDFLTLPSSISLVK